MNKTFILRGKVQAQALWAFLKANWEACAESGKPLQIDIGPEKTTRSIQANKRYWAILRCISETGWIHGQQFSQEAWHEFYKRKFIGCLDLPGGQVVGLSSAKLSIEDFTAYMTQVEAHAATELGVEFMEAA